MYALVLVTRDDEELGAGWLHSTGTGYALEMDDDVLLDIDAECALEVLAQVMSASGVYVGACAEVDGCRDDGTRYQLEVLDVYLSYDETLEVLPEADGVVFDKVTGSTTDEQLRHLVEDYVKEIRDETGAEPSRRAIEWWLWKVRDVARDVENEPENPC